MVLKRLRHLLLIFTIVLNQVGFSADYFWIGNSGDWSDLSHWASFSGGAGGAFGSLPTTADNVRFDANSFSIGGQTVTADVDAFAANLNFTGVTNNPSFDGGGPIEISVGGSLTFVAGMSHDFAGDYEFVATSAENITSAGKTISGDILFNGSGGTWSLSDNINVGGEIGLQNGIFDMNGFDLIAGSINANNGSAIRTIDFDNSTVTITDAGTVLDLRGNTTNLSVITIGATIDFTNAGDITVETGDEIKTIPAMTFSACSGDIRIFTGGTEEPTKRITFEAIVASVDGVDFRVEANNDNSNIKTFASITLPDNCRYIIGSGDGSGGFGGTDHTIITGDFIVGNDGEGDIRGRYIEFLSDYVAGTETDCRFISQTQFQNDVTIQSSGMNNVIFDNDIELAGDLTINGDVLIRLDEEVNIAGDIIVANDVTLTLDNSGLNAETTVSGTLNLGVQSIVDVGAGGIGLFDFANIDMGSEAQINFNNNTSATTIDNFTLSSYNIVRFNTLGICNITGTMTASGSCDIWLWLKSLTDGATAEINFSSAQNITANICQDLNCSSTNLTNTSGVDLSNNTGITFTASVVSNTFFWVGSTTGNTKTGTFTTGVNDDWSNPDNWSLTSGLYTGTNSCIPGAHDDVVFNAISFSAGAGTVNLDLIIQACNSMTWTGIPVGCTMDGDLIDEAREFIIFGNITLNANLDNQFESLVTFSAHDATIRTISLNGSNFFGNVDFDFVGGTWSLLDNFDMDGEERADVRFRQGTVLANSANWTIEDDWTVIDGTFSAGTSRIEFDGPAAQNTRQEITTDGDPFFDLYINRGTNGGGANDFCRTLDPITINNDLNIIRGGLDDFGFQITGSALGNMDIENNARILLARDDVATLFPTNYITANIDLNESSRTYYNSDITQTVSNVPDYGSIFLQNVPDGGTLAAKIMDGPISVTNIIFINDFNNLIDNGFQITGDAGEEIQMDPNSQLTLGSATSSTVFPTDHTIFDLNEPCTVVYNSGLDQAIKGIAGAGDARYWHVIVNNAAGAGTPLKTLDGDMIIRGDLTINTDNEVDVNDPSDFSIELEGNWTNSGDFLEHEGAVIFTGTGGQTLISGGTAEGFYDYTINNTSVASLTIEDDISASNSLTFVDGIIYRGVAGTEVVRILDGAAVSGASNNSHVDGQVEKTGNVAFDFPVGKNDFYRPISIGAPSIGATGFIAEYFQEDPHPTFDDGSLEASLDRISSCEYWILDHSNGVLGNATVTLSWITETSCGVSMISDLSVARWDGAIWRNEGNGGTTGADAAGTIISGAAVTSFSPFTLASISDFNPLPIELLSFDATLVYDQVNLEWVTASEINNDFFTIERSSNAVDFAPIAKQNGAGNSSAELTYYQIDRKPLLGVSYYRLKQTDYDGTFAYSDVRLVNYRLDEAFVYPNPVANQSELYLYLPEGFEDTMLEIYNVSGSLIETTLASSGLNQLSIFNYVQGTYLIKIVNTTNAETIRFVVQ